jgi:hypothetical protein
MFMNGFADCKIAVDKMTARQAIKFLRAVTDNVMRDSARQYLTASFNINSPIVDDRNGAARLVTKHADIARLGIDVATRGGFDRVAWDGASNQVPSQPVLELFSFANALTLVHEAHEKGLETYVSSGMRSEHMGDAVRLGVGGAGIGTSLHHVDPETRLIGGMNIHAIRQAIARRDRATSDWQGRTARLLARLDRLYFEKALPVELDSPRRSLFEALQMEDKATALRLTGNFGVVERMADDVDHPVIERAKRLITWADREPIAAAEMSFFDWRAFIGDVQGLLACRDVAQLREVLT